MMRRKGQAAMEYAMIAGFIAALIIPAIFLFYQYTQESVSRVDVAQLNKLGKEITVAAEKVYYLGPPSRLALEANMPKNVKNVQVVTGPTGIYVLNIDYTAHKVGAQTASFASKIPLRGIFAGSLKERALTEGPKTVIIEAYEDPSGPVTAFAYINFGGRCPRSTTYNFTQHVMPANAADATFLKNCYCDNPGTPKARPSKAWETGWFEGPAPGLSYQACMNADYDADCDVDGADAAAFCAAAPGVGFCPGLPTCP